MTGTLPDQGPSPYLAAVVRFAETLRLAPPASAAWTGDPGPARRRTDDDLAPWLLAADLARARYPGPVGEVLAREIRAFLEVGHRFGRDALITRVVSDLLEPVPVDQR